MSDALSTESFISTIAERTQFIPKKFSSIKEVLVDFKESLPNSSEDPGNPCMNGTSLRNKGQKFIYAFGEKFNVISRVFLEISDQNRKELKEYITDIGIPNRVWYFRDTKLFIMLWYIHETSDFKKYIKTVFLLRCCLRGDKDLWVPERTIRTPDNNCNYYSFHDETKNLEHYHSIAQKYNIPEAIQDILNTNIDFYIIQLTEGIISSKQKMTYEKAIEHYYGLRYNTLNQKIYDKNGKVFQDFKLLYLELKDKLIKDRFKFHDDSDRKTFPKGQRTIDAALLSAKQHSFDPLQEQFDGWAKKVEDGDYDKNLDINNLATRFLNPNASEFENQVFKHWLVGAVERIRNPGCKMELCMILHGEQGVGKTTTLQILGGQFFAEDVTFSRDLNMTLTRIGHHILELSEMTNKNMNANLIKTAISNQYERYRGLYENHMSEIPRRCVFAGTSNEQYFLNDPTGNRRFAIIEVTNHALKNSDELRRKRDDIFCAILAAILKDKLIPVIPEKYLAIQREINERFSADINEIYEERITDFLEIIFDNQKKNKLDAPLTMLLIYEYALGGNPLNITRKHKDEISCVMKQLGFKYVRIYHQGKRIRVWKKK